MSSYKIKWKKKMCLIQIEKSMQQQQKKKRQDRITTNK